MYRDFFEMVGQAGISLHGAEVFHNGEIVLKRSFDGDIAHPIYSATKSVTAAAVLMAEGEGKLSVKDKLYYYMDSKYLSVMPDGFRQLSFTDCMTMCAAPYPFRPQNAAEQTERGRKDDWLYSIFRLDTDYSDRRFHYSNIPAYLVSAACENAVGQSLADWLRPRLFEPLGWGSPIYQLSPEGHFYGATGMYLTVSQLARLGQLFLQKGEFMGAQLIRRDLAEAAVTRHVFSQDGEGYGWFFWVSDNTFDISGKWGQRCVANPKTGLMVTYLSDNSDRSGELTDIARRFVASAE